MNFEPADPTREPGRLSLWLLGRERRQRAHMQFALIALGVYAFCLAAQWQAVMTGMVAVDRAIELTCVLVVIQLTLLALIRSGVARYLNDSWLALSQMVIAIVLIAWAYLINAHLNGVLLMLVALVLSYSAMALSPRLCLAIGGFAVAVFAVVIVVAVQRAPARFPPQREYIHLAFLVVVLPTLSFIASQASRMRLQLKRQRGELRASLASIEKIATSDELTGLKNRRFVNDWLRLQVAQSRRLDVPVCIAVLDIDHFKRVNDQRGHTVGDLVLKEFASVARGVVRDGEVFARWGGEEFLWVMTGADPQRAVLAVDRLRALVNASPHWATQPGWTVSFSAGVAEINPRLDIEDALRNADEALYRAKANGRARTELH